ncbi:MAG: class I SAM-dependent methyltransferase [Magnetococcales bacterium]|nr:class I SAM-dependent methyltransferase [Magnetococcales bacterium]
MLKRFSWARGGRYLDLGCGPGENLAGLAVHFDYSLGLDCSPLALSLARQANPGLQFVQGDVNQLERLFQANSFRLISDFNVLCHRWVSSEKETIRAIYALLEEGGVVVMTEPVYNILYREADELTMTSRRFGSGELRGWLQEAGFVVRQETMFNAAPLPLALLMAGWYRFRKRFGIVGGRDGHRGEDQLGGKWGQWLMTGVCRVEYGWIRLFGRLPLGLTCLIVAQKGGERTGD